MRVSLINQVTGGLTGMARQFAAVHGDAKALQATLDKIKLTGLVGGALVGAGALGLHLLHAPLEEAKRYQTEVAKFRQFGLSEAGNRDAMAFADNMNVVGTSYTQANGT